MIFRRPAEDDPLDQGDIIDGCPLVSIINYDVGNLDLMETEHGYHRVIVMTQTCDLATGRSPDIVVATVFEAETLVARGILKRKDIKGSIRAGRVFGWYFLPKSEDIGLTESIIDLRQLQAVRADLLQDLCRAGKRLARLQPLYREHVAKHFADTYSRIGLPAPYPSD